MYPILFSFRGIKIYTYGFLIALGFILGLILALRQAKKEKVSAEIINDLFFWIFVTGFIGARVTYIFTEWPYFLNNPLSFIFAREGFVFYGGFISAFLFSYFYLIVKKIPFLKILDILAPSLALAHSLGRLGCFFYGCCYGKPTKSFIGITFPKDSPAGACGLPVVPTQLIESFILFIIFLVLIYIKKYKKNDGEVFWLYISLYAAVRFVIEFFRGDPRGQIFFFSTSGFIALILFFVGSIMFLKSKYSK